MKTPIQLFNEFKNMPLGKQSLIATATITLIITFLSNYKSIKNGSKPEVKKAAKTGFEKKDIQEVKNIISKDLDEVSASEKKGDAFQVEEELGDLLFSAVELCRLYNVDANVALENANRKFIKRFKCNETKDRQ